MYTEGFLLLMSFIGVLLHILVKLDEENKASNYKINMGMFIKTNWIPTLISMIVSCTLVPFSQEIHQIHDMGKLGALLYVPIAYMGQSILMKYLKKAAKVVDDDTPKD